MPRKNRKRNAASDGWTTITSGSPNRPANVSHSGLKPGDEDKFMNVSYDQLWKKYLRIKDELEKSQSWSVIKKNLQDIMLPVVRPENDGALRMKKCVVLGLGSTISFHGDRNSLFQLALLDLIANYMGWAKELATKGALFAQDPVFQDLDKKLLENTLGFQVVEDPRAFDEIDEDTFLYAPHLEDLFNQKAVNKWPFWAFVNNLERYSSFGAIAPNLHHTKELTKFHEQMIAYMDEHENMNFPYSEKVADGRAFNDCVFYWRSESRKGRTPRKVSLTIPRPEDRQEIKETEDQKYDNATSDPVQEQTGEKSNPDSSKDVSEVSGDGDIISDTSDLATARLSHEGKGKGKASTCDIGEPFYKIQELKRIDDEASLILQEQIRMDEQLARQLQEEETGDVPLNQNYQNILGRPEGTSEQEWGDKLYAMELSNEPQEWKSEPEKLKAQKKRVTIEDGGYGKDEVPETSDTNDGMKVDPTADTQQPGKAATSDGEESSQLTQSFLPSRASQASSEGGGLGIAQ